ncbi:MAG: 2,3-bisphosphoglycerate-independent phosphoglycerate mutase [Nanoarchaeota archaeon]|nr:2,3-bisphosphoglycerate-independent phosphoglycerate mutase [Nanoarchaeota archaeon]
MAKPAKGSKFVFVVLDGAADRPIREFGNKTPFEIAYKPNLDYFAKNGKTGCMHVVKKGIAPESDSAIMALLGYDPFVHFTGRGPLEAYGSGVPFKRGDLVLRTNFATVKNNKIIDRRVNRSLTTREADILADTINKKVKLGFPFFFKPTIHHRGVFLVKGSFSDNITNTDPGYKKKGKFAVAVKGKNVVQDSKPLDDEEITNLSANIINNFVEQSNKILNSHPLNIVRIKSGLLPANIILTRDAGISLPKIPMKGEKWLALAGMPLEIGIAKLSGMHIDKFQYPELKSTNIYANLYHALKLYLDFAKKEIEKNWKNFDAFYVHIKETDVAGHDGIPLHKKKMIELVDEILFSYLRKKDIKLCVTCDHSTPCNMRMHSSDTVPVMIYGKGKDKGEKFDEKSCKKGSLKNVLGKDLLKLAM